MTAVVPETNTPGTTPTVLALVPFYLPAYKAGGCVRSVSTIVSALSGSCRFIIVCRDRDLGDQRAFPDVAPNQWNEVGAARVCYIPPGVSGMRSLYCLLKDAKWDVLYLNSFFSMVFTLFPLALQRVGLLRHAPVLLAVRGELHEGALAIKRWRKIGYRFMARCLGLYNRVAWHVAGPMERADLCTAFLKQRRNADIVECGDAVGELECFMPEETIDKQAGELRVVFLSRITRNKNLAYALRLMHGIAGRVVLDIYGPQEDMAYWAECESLMRSLPRNIVTRYCGVVGPRDVDATFARYHLFLFPSAGESFGHVIREAICAGCPVMTSDRTPWLLDQARAGWCIPLSAPDQFCTELQRLVWMDGAEYAAIRNAAMQLGELSVAVAKRNSEELAVAFHQLATMRR